MATLMPMNDRRSPFPLRLLNSLWAMQKFAAWNSLRLAVSVLCVAIMLLVGGVVSLLAGLRSQAGTQLFIALTPGISATGIQGPLLGDFCARTLRVQWSLLGDRIELDNFCAKGFHLEANPARQLWAGFHWNSWTADSLRVALSPHTAPDHAPLESLFLPVSVSVKQIELGQLWAPGLGSDGLRAVRGEAYLGAQGGDQHQFTRIEARWGQVQARGDLQVQSRAPLNVNAQVQADVLPVQTAPSGPTGASAKSALPPWAQALHAEFRAEGPLANLNLNASLDRRGRQATPSPQGSVAPVLEANAVLRMFDAWVFPTVRARLDGLDLQVLHRDLARTSLSGEATLLPQSAPAPRSKPANEPTQVPLEMGASELRLSLVNGEAGPLDMQRWPIRRLQAQLDGHPQAWLQGKELESARVQADLGTQRQYAGRLQAKAQIDGQGWRLDTQLSEVRPQALDTRAAAMVLGGPITVTRKDAALAKGSVSSLEFNAKLAGVLRDPRVLSAEMPVALNALASAQWPSHSMPEKLAAPDSRASSSSAGRAVFEIKQAQASVGGAFASMALRAEQPLDKASGNWRAKGELQLSEFDPLPWWPGVADSTWRKTRHRLNALAKLDLQWRSDLEHSPLNFDLPASGQASVEIKPSSLAGVAVSGLLELNKPLSGADLALGAALQAGGNELKLGGLIGRQDLIVGGKLGGSRRGSNLSLTLRAEDTSTLKPWLRMGLELAQESELARQANLEGSVQAQLDLQGSWPAIQSQGWMQVQRLEAGRLRLEQGRAEWSAAHPVALPDMAQKLRITLTDLHWQGKAVANHLQLQAEGSAKDHHWSGQVGSGVLPPEWTLALRSKLGATTATSSAGSSPMIGTAVDNTVASFAVRGQMLLAEQSKRPLRPTLGWQGEVEHIHLRSRACAMAVSAPGGGSSGTPECAAFSSWLEASHVPLTWIWAEGDGDPLPWDVQIGSARGQFAGASLRWKALKWQEGGAGHTSDLQAEVQLEPLKVAPILAQLQPDFGWRGDLTVKGHLHLRNRPGLVLDGLIERDSGDLTLSDEGLTQALGLSDFRLALSAQEGRWTFTQALAGRAVGVAAGAFSLQTQSAQSWPTADSAVNGVLELRIADLGALTPWVPAGWRPSGSVRASAALAGTLGQPQVTGEIQAEKLALRNPVEGINFQEGRAHLVSDGNRLQVKVLQIGAGKGHLNLQGGMTLGDKPQGDFQIRAERFGLLSRVDRRLSLSGEGQLQVDPQWLRLHSHLTLDEGLLDIGQLGGSTMPEDVRVIRTRAVDTPARKSSSASEPAKGCTLMGRRCDIELKLDLGQKLRLRGRGLQAGLMGEVQIQGQDTRPRIEGLITVMEGGSYSAYGQRLNIEHGRINLSGNLDNPRIDTDIEATRKLSEFISPSGVSNQPEVTRVGIALTGPLTNLQAKLISEPDTLTDTQKLTWLVLGRAPEAEQGSNENALLQQAALALLMGENDGVNIRQLGLDDVSLSGSGVRLGKQVSDRLYVGYERTVNTAEDSFQVVYRLAKQLSVSWQRLGDSGNALLLNWSWRWS
jgi:translocation and assembly module TamB